MMIEGDLKNVELASVLYRLAVAASNGILTVQGQDDIVAVSFLGGRIVAADALAETVEDGLGEVLRAQGLVPEAELDAAVEDYQGSGGTLGDLLVERDLISREELLESLRTQTYQLMLRLLPWREGEFKFYGGDEVSHEEGFVPLAVEELLIRAVEDLGERSGLGANVPSLDEIYRQVPQRAPVKVLGVDGDGGDGATWLSPEQEAFLDRVDGRRPASAIAQEADLGRYRAQFVALTLTRHDLIEGAGRAPAAEPSSPSVEVDLPLQLDEPDDATSPYLRAEIFTPPDPDAEPSEASPARVRSPIQLLPWVGPLLGAALVVAAVATWHLPVAGIAAPFPGQGEERAAFIEQLRASLFARIDGAARAHYLVHDRYPESLADLVDLGLLTAADAHDAAGLRLRYEVEGSAYRIVLLDGTQTVDDLGASEGITGDLLLDPQVIRTGTVERQPLILLD